MNRTGPMRRPRCVGAACAGSLLVLGSLLAPWAVGLSQNLTHLNIQAVLQRAGESEAWTVSFTLAVGGDVSGYAVSIQFPDGFIVPPSALCSIDGASGVATTVNGPSVLCTIGSGSYHSGDTLSTHVTNIQAPSTAQTSGAFTVQWVSSAHVVLASDDSTTVPIHANRFPSASFTAVDDRAGESSEWTLAFTTKNPVEANGDLRLVLPSGFTLGSDAACSIAGLAGPSLSWVSSTEAVCNLNAGSLAALTGYSLTLTGVTNPPASRDPALTTLTVESRDPSGLLHDVRSDVGVLVEPHPFMATPRVTAGDAHAGAITSYQFTVDLFNPWPADGGFQVTLPPGYALNAGGASTLSIVSGADGGMGSTNIDGLSARATRTGGGTPSNSGDPITFSLSNIKNPPDPVGTVNSVLSTVTSAANTVIDLAHGFPLPPIITGPSPTDPTTVTDPTNWDRRHTGGATEGGSPDDQSMDPTRGGSPSGPADPLKTGVPAVGRAIEKVLLTQVGGVPAWAPVVLVALAGLCYVSLAVWFHRARKSLRDARAPVAALKGSPRGRQAPPRAPPRP